MHRIVKTVIGMTVMRGTSVHDEASSWTISQVADAVAESIVDAEQSQLQTSVHPSRGIWVYWDQDHDPEARSVYESLVDNTLAGFFRAKVLS